MQGISEALDYMENNRLPMQEKDLEGLQKVFEKMSYNDPYYTSIKGFIENIIISKNN